MTTEEVQLIYAENIRRRRIEKGLTQEQLAEKIGMSPKYNGRLSCGIICFL